MLDVKYQIDKLDRHRSKKNQTMLTVAFEHSK